jgi:hypothetical protein
MIVRWIDRWMDGYRETSAIVWPLKRSDSFPVCGGLKRILCKNHVSDQFNLCGFVWAEIGQLINSSIPATIEMETPPKAHISKVSLFSLDCSLSRPSIWGISGWKQSCQIPRTSMPRTKNCGRAKRLDSSVQTIHVSLMHFGGLGKLQVVGLWESVAHSSWFEYW